MTRRALIRDEARRDIDLQASYYRRASPALALRFLGSLEDALTALVAAPGRGHPGRMAHPILRGIRSSPIPGFERILIFYRPSAGGIEVLAVTHGARDIPALFGAEEE